MTDGPAATAGLRCRALLFDLDGVLVDSVGNTRNAWRAWAAGHGLDGDEVHRAGHGRRSEDTVAAVAPWLDPAVEVPFVEHLESTTTDELDPVPGAAALLAALPGDAWAIVTSGTRAVALHRIAYCALPTPPLLLTAEDVANGKPHPEPYLTAADRLGVAPADCVVVEDAVAGIAAARAGAMRSVFVGPADAPGAADADIVAVHLADLDVARDGEWLVVGLAGAATAAS
jgi:mannitol-1-/sugar-/sorbitol-6-phosphatase